MRFYRYLGLLGLLIFILVGCKAQSDNNQSIVSLEYKYNQDLNIIDDNYRTYYEVFLYSFYDSDGDGIGDINGLISQLDYINDGNPDTDTDLGFNGIWLMPIMPSDTYHKYDVKDYYDIDPEYGTLEDFKRLVNECDKRGIKLIIDLVINHSSQLHPWFKSALQSLSIEPCGQETCIHEKLCRDHNPYVGYYSFVEGKPDKGNYYPTGVGDWYYEGVFTSNMPDLNLANEDLRRDIEDIMKYWMEIGVGGFRLDAALHYFSDNNDKNIEVLSWLNKYVKDYKNDNYIVAEVWTNFSTYSKYYTSGIDSVFNFSFAAESGRITKTLNYKGNSNSAKAFGESMILLQEGLARYSDTAIDAPFFTNHDTARAAGYFLGNPLKTKMAGGLSLMMNGNVFVYYGEELGMSGSGRDENKRAPMYWYDTYMKGMTYGPKDMEKIEHSFGSLESQSKDPLSIYNYYKRAVRLRNENPEIARGVIAYMTEIDDEDICAISKSYKESTIYMLYNISEEAKEVTVSKTTYPYKDIRGYLSTTGEEVLLTGETLTLPPYSIVILK
jgi:glycosidase